MAEDKTKPTKVLVKDFLKTVSEKRLTESEKLISLMQDVSGEKPVMWGPSIIGFGLQHYKSEAGREGDMAILGFSPRKAALTIYFYEGFDRYGEELNQLGKYKISQSCLYINKLDDIDFSIFKKMLISSYRIASQSTEETLSVEKYIAQVPAPAKKQFDELRQLVKSQMGSAHEVVSYGIIGYKKDVNKRATIFISGWKDHVAVYPIPKNEKLKQELKPYIKGRGTLWFALDRPLPKQLLKNVVSELQKSA